jgi:hypothetical protein
MLWLLLHSEILQEFQDLVKNNRQCYCLFDGDFIADLNVETNISAMVNDFIVCNCLSRCDILFPMSFPYTYVNESMNVKSTIDYF